MRRGCIAVEQVQCDGCHRLIKPGERYLVIDVEGGERQRLCVDCCLSHSYASYTDEGGKNIITFLPKN
jgi:hypothetical protein